MKNDTSLPDNTHQYIAPDTATHTRTTKHDKNNQRLNIPEFVKKLFSMLENNAYPSILTWGLEGKTFIVIEPTEFSKLVLPQHFKHANFASFVRQLNKYDFHKIRHQNDAWPYGHQAWEFYHSHFRYKQKELLKGIKRKPTNHTNTKIPSKPSTQKLLLPSTVSTIDREIVSEEMCTLSQELIEIQKSHLALTNKLRSMALQHEFVVETVLGFKKVMTAQDDFIHTIANNLGGGSDDPLLLQLSSQSDQDRLTKISQYIEEKQRQLSPYLKFDQGALHVPPPPILVPPSAVPSIRDDHHFCQWSMNPRVLLAVSNKDSNNKNIQDLMYQWLDSFGCLIESKYINSLDDPFDTCDRYDLLFVDEDLLSANLRVLTNMRQANPWIPLIGLCKEISEQSFLDWIKYGVTDVLSRPFQQKSICKMVDKYCSHMRLS
ncbi:HSF-type DNA-binding-domain-containing protein [Chlamydoabsidia padenii]|nr:HSF-type DNA-binding-domain-containing protein [Chlamydoabsidia padenii]